jgi:hypothetical protein
MKGIWVVFFLACLGCRHKTPQQKFADYINDPENKITQKITVGNVTSTLKWMLSDYRRLIDTTIEEMDGYNYFNIKFEKGGENKLAKEKIMYLDFDMQNDFALVSGKDSVLPAICQRIQNGHASSYEYMLAFEKKRKNDKVDFTVVYKDKIFGIGTIAFVYKLEDINKIPTLAAK